MKNYSTSRTFFLALSLGCVILSSPVARATKGLRLVGKWAGVVTQSGTPTLFGVDQWGLKRQRVTVTFRSDGTGTFAEPAGRSSSNGHGKFVYSLRGDTLRLRTTRIFEGDGKEFVPTIEFPPEVYRVRFTRGKLVMKQRGHDVRFVLRPSRSTMSGSSAAKSASKPLPREAARKASTTSRRRVRSAPRPVAAIREIERK